ncbi:MAG: hypothetical protein DWQ31_14520 [Planctomycetota bacterium]|nr:MAG: hypothetical protein DWQ31_14520 [Planctomycetota bacterium]
MATLVETAKSWLPQQVRRPLRGSRRWLTSPLRTLPDYLIIGAAKSGTTSLYKYLCRHPRVLPAARKEVRYFSHHLDRGASWYRAHFPLAVTKWNQRSITGEASPTYLQDLRIPRHVRAVVPEARLLVLLRNPVDQAYSGYHMTRHNYPSDLSFEDYIAWSTEQIAEHVFGVRLAKRNQNGVTDRLLCGSVLDSGLYAMQLTAWFHHFPRDQFLVIPSERFFADTQGSLDRITDFLGIPRSTWPEFPVYNRTPYPPMNPATRNRLIEHYRPHNARLYQLLGEEFAWDR